MAHAHMFISVLTFFSSSVHCFFFFRWNLFAHAHDTLKMHLYLSHAATEKERITTENIHDTIIHYWNVWIKLWMSVSLFLCVIFSDSNRNSIKSISVYFCGVFFLCFFLIWLLFGAMCRLCETISVHWPCVNAHTQHRSLLNKCSVWMRIYGICQIINGPLHPYRTAVKIAHCVSLEIANGRHTQRTNQANKTQRRTQKTSLHDDSSSV